MGSSLTRAHGEATGIEAPYIWAAERVRRMRVELQGDGY